MNKTASFQTFCSVTSCFDLFFKFILINGMDNNHMLSPVQNGPNRSKSL